MEKQKKNWPVIEVPASGNRGWSGGAFTLAFVYSNSGNFLLKGYYEEVQNYIKKRKTEGLKYFVRYVLIHEGKKREILRFYLDHIGIFSPSRICSSKRWTKDSRKFIIREYTNGFKQVSDLKIKLKRMPNRWIKEFEQF